MPGYGDCLAMDTSSSSGQWMNFDCAAKLPVACVRKRALHHNLSVLNTQFAENHDAESAVPTCISGPYEEGAIVRVSLWQSDWQLTFGSFLT